MGMHGSLSARAVEKIQRVIADIKYYSTIQDGPLYVSRDLVDFSSVNHIYSIEFYWADGGRVQSTIGVDAQDPFGYIVRRAIRYFELRKVFIPVKYDEDTKVQMALGTFPQSYLITHRIDKSRIK